MQYLICNQLSLFTVKDIYFLRLMRLSIVAGMPTCNGGPLLLGPIPNCRLKKLHGHPRAFIFTLLESHLYESLGCTYAVGAQ